MLPHSTAMISSDRGVFINGGQFNQHYHHGQATVGNKTPIDVLTEAVAPSAFYDSGASFDKPKCHPRTRSKILEDIMCWILGEDEDGQIGKQFMWLNGAAGCGKSAIAQSTIESCIERGVLLASFFFSRSDSTRNHAGSLVATLAYQLYCAFPGTEVQTEILSVIQQDPLIFKKTLQRQFTSLIIQPLFTHFSKNQSTQHRVPFLIVIDGLDECTDRNAQKAIITDMADSLRNSNHSIQIFVASRPEHDIKLSFSSKYLKEVHIGLSLDLENGREADSDIRLYLFDRFAEIKDDFNNRTTGRKLVQDWPGDEIITKLVWKSSRQFIYAATVIRYVESTRHRPDQRLDTILNFRPVNADHPFTELDSLYTMILESASDIEKVLHVLSLYLMDVRHVCCSVIEKILSYDEGEVEALFCDMGALVQISKPRYFFPYPELEYDPEYSPLLLHILHASLEEYLLDAARSKQFHIDIHYETIKHVTHALQYLASCCSSSFNPSSMAGAPTYILYQYQYHMCPRTDHITISPELRQLALSFPLKEFLEPHISTNIYPQLLQFVVTPFLELLQDIVVSDPTLSYIQYHQLEILRSDIIQQIPQYLNDDRLTLVLVLFYHLGSQRFVPALRGGRVGCSGYSYTTPFHVHHEDCDEGDILSLSRLWYTWRTPIQGNYYHHVVRHWQKSLHDPRRPTQYALGPITHERAALFCLKELAATVPPLTSPSGKNIKISPVTNDAEDDTHPMLNFIQDVNCGQWRFLCSTKSALEDEELYFLLLGYITFLLPRCGRSDALVAACEEYRTSHIDQPDGPFPVRRKLLHKEINNYLARVYVTNFACMVQ
ncbi:hypothetical protein D9613_006360 [Agrocybe pediades]|uniref:Nephrocystin 3-like N-terminal domain-containing protein n=1 Tax=Agrocybe pediades TaxID=84607 RepID=A0A8H4VR89_9AGAR|nr:hypothetical protein D9613_006360 [Agrocybe pediades]